MKTKFNSPMHAHPSQTASLSEPSEANIRECAYDLYEKANCCDGHDLEHWAEATAVLKAQAVAAQTASHR